MAIHYTVWGENVGRNGIVAIVSFLIFLIKNWKMKSCKQGGWGLMDLVWFGFSSFLSEAISALKLAVKRTRFCPANKTGSIFSSVGRATLRSLWPPWPDLGSLCSAEVKSPADPMARPWQPVFCRGQPPSFLTHLQKPCLHFPGCCLFCSRVQSPCVTQEQSWLGLKR